MRGRRSIGRTWSFLQAMIGPDVRRTYDRDLRSRCMQSLLCGRRCMIYQLQVLYINTFAMFIRKARAGPPAGRDQTSTYVT